MILTENLAFLLGGALLSLITAYLLGLRIIPWLRKLKLGQQILDIGPKWHMGKQGTPIMGGIIFILASSAVMLLLGVIMHADLKRALNVLVFALFFALIGFIDDFQKIRQKRNLGLRPMQKIVLQLSVALVFLFTMRIFGFVTPTIYLPFLDIEWTVNWVIYMAFGAFIIVGFVNAVNFNDGLDGLAAGTTLPVMIFFSASFLILGEAGMGLYGACMAGALLGFLIFNFPPARVFMGDTGSLFLGGIVCGMAFALDMPLILVTVGLVYALEALSVMLQVTYFKLTKGKRIFKMTPIHHHFEMLGYSERKITLASALITAALCAISFIAVLKR